MLVYGSYLSPDAPVARTAFAAVFADTSAALMAALFIFPTILVFGLDPESGPRLLFETLPSLFGQMDAGRLLGSFFLLAFFLVAFLSGLAAFEVVVSSISDDASLHGLDRKKCIIIFGLIEFLLMAFPAFNPDIIATLDLIFGTGLQATGCAMAIIALTWFITRQKVIAQLALGKFTPLVYAWLKWVIPVVFFIIILGFIFSWA
jgi:NSS family neurotransmitter:Na+ symporter